MNNHLNLARRLATLLDSKFSIFGFKFGIDPILGLLPGGGDALTLLVSGYIIWIGIKLDIPKLEIARMIGNIALDFVVGTIPLIGDLFDTAYKANLKNIQILNNYA